MPRQKQRKMINHAARTAHLTAQVKQFYDEKKPFRVYHGSTNSTRTISFNRAAMIDTSAFNHILGIDPGAQTALVESNVSMDKLVIATLKHGLIPPVVPEFPGITVGGAIQGGAGESSSFKWGNVSDTVNWQEMISADGSLVRTSPQENADLFWGTAGSYGSLGVITAAEVRLLPAKRFVNLTYIPITSFDEAVSTAMDATHQNYDFVDGILFAPNQGVIIVGSLSDAPVTKVHHFRHAHNEWFYLHAEKRAALHEPVQESVPIIDYLFRYDRGAFWMGKHAFDTFGFPFNRANRLLLNGLLTTRRMYQALHGSHASQNFIIQDLALPATNAPRFLDFVNRTFQIYPLWLCPLTVDTSSPLQVSHLRAKEIINIGVWGPFNGTHQEFIRANRLLEQTVHKLGGRKWLYAHTYYSPEEFWEIYDESWYARLRAAYHAQSLPSIYEKVRASDAPRAISRKRGLWKAMTGSQGLIES